MYDLHLEGLIIKGRYLIQRRLRCGSYTELFRGYDRHANRLVILKALNVALKGMPDAELEQKLMDYFQREADVLGQLQHPHIITCLDYDRASDRHGRTFPYLVIEYMAGGDLMDLCRRRPLSLDRALDYVDQVCQGLAHAHKRGIIHRDIKPQNLLLDAHRRIIKISDFGIAKVLHDDQAEVTRGIGTEPYAPPECFGLEGPACKLTPAADVYGLAKTVYVMVGGEAPRQFVQQPITSLPATVSAQPWAAQLLGILQQATQRDPAKRYATITAFQEALGGLRAVAEQAEQRDEDEVTVVPGAGRSPRPPDRSIHMAAVRGERIEVSLQRDNTPSDQHNQSGLTGPGSAPGSMSVLQSPPIQWNRRVFMFGVMTGFVGVMFWIHHRVGSDSPRETLQTGVVTADNLNLREHPTTSSAVRCTIPGGARLEILRQSADGLWFEVQTMSCWDVQKQGWRRARGWVSSRYVKRTGG